MDVENMKYLDYREIPVVPRASPALPLRADCSDDGSASSESDSDDDVQWKRKRSSQEKPKRNGLAARSAAFATSAGEFQTSLHNVTRTQPAEPHRAVKRNNVWGNVLSEQMLSEDIHGCGVRKVHVDDGRNVESYAYWRKNDLEEPPPPPRKDIAPKASMSSNQRKRKKIPLMTYASDETDESVGNRIAAKLQETKTYLIANVVKELGKERAVKLLQKTEEIERMGGMLTVQGDRRRTAGGVFFRVLKDDPHVTRVQMDSIFAEEKKEAEEKRKKLKAVSQQKKFAKFKKRVEAGDMEVALPTVQDFVLRNATSGGDAHDGAAALNDAKEKQPASNNADEELEPGEIVDDDDETMVS